MFAEDFVIKRDDPLCDYFANSVAKAIFESWKSDGSLGMAPRLKTDFLKLCDNIFKTIKLEDFTLTEKDIDKFICHLDFSEFVYSNLWENLYHPLYEGDEE